MKVDLDKLLDDSIKEKNGILRDLEPLKAEKAKLMKELQPTEKKLKVVKEEIAKIEADRDLTGASKTIARLTRTGSKNKNLKAEVGSIREEA